MTETNTSWIKFPLSNHRLLWKFPKITFAPRRTNVELQNLATVSLKAIEIYISVYVWCLSKSEKRLTINTKRELIILIPNGMETDSI